MLRLALLATLFTTSGYLTAQPPGGPATNLFLHNGTKQPATFEVIRQGDAGATVVTLVAVAAKQSANVRIANVPGDRVLFARKGGAGPWQVYGTSSFDASSSPFPTVGYTLTEDTQGNVRLQQLLQGEAPKATTELKEGEKQ